MAKIFGLKAQRSSGRVSMREDLPGTCVRQSYLEALFTYSPRQTVSLFFDRSSYSSRRSVRRYILPQKVENTKFDGCIDA